MMGKKYNVSMFINKVHEYLDDALSEKECNEFIKDVHQNPRLIHILNNERNLRTTIKNQLQRPKVKKSFIESIKERLYS